MLMSPLYADSTQCNVAFVLPARPVVHELAAPRPASSKQSATRMKLTSNAKAHTCCEVLRSGCDSAGGSDGDDGTWV
eukprot:123258-Hanusia_phi.AAC.3